MIEILCMLPKSDKGIIESLCILLGVLRYDLVIYLGSIAIEAIKSLQLWMDIVIGVI